jgi:hypothetical protein
MRYRLHSPLRWLCATMSAMFLFAMVGVLDSLWLLPLVPLALGLFLLAPPLGPYHHAENAPARTSVTVALQRSQGGDVPNGDTWTLRLQNTGKADARHFRIRMTIPTEMLPSAAVSRLLLRGHVGQSGTHWFVKPAGSTPCSPSAPVRPNALTRSASRRAARSTWPTCCCPSGHPVRLAIRSTAAA